MMKVKSERENLRQENSKLQRDLSARAQADEKVQEQLQALLADKAGLQEQLQQAQQAQQADRSVPAGSLPLQSAGANKDATDHGYTNTWRLVDQLRNQNR